jgi:hypothetical protein
MQLHVMCNLSYATTQICSCMCHMQLNFSCKRQLQNPEFLVMLPTYPCTHPFKSYLPTYPSIHSPTHLLTYLPTSYNPPYHLPTIPPTHLFMYLPIHPSYLFFTTYLPTHPLIYLPTHSPTYLLPTIL